ncbi:MAG: PQQ-dependent sugar dehydrogenase [Acidimicrobiales bacterium]|nr:PQQ-dependent sugar dehydrogenase [Acidimicrobiales bacterium]MCB9373529.1 PQQ-dependent sugar dehydrogenase [Microthrixaceae bacterium]
MHRALRPPRRRTARILLATLLGAAVALGSAPAGGAAPGADGDPGAEGGLPALQLTPVATLDQPIAMATLAGSDDLFVAERGGRVRRLVVGSPDPVDPTPLLDLSGLTTSSGEGGLLGLAFHPAGDRLYVFHTNVRGNLRVAEYQLTGGPTDPTVVPNSRRVVLSIRHQPFDNHNGGDLAFGPDGKLYITVGDGGGGGDPANNGQNRQVLLGKILRINPAPGATRPYKVPVTNPFVRQAPRRGEIWLFGVRNPWRISFDRANGDLYVADVGQNEFEEVNVLPSDATGRNAGKGLNLGWRRMEGLEPFGGATEPRRHTRPTFVYDHGDGCSITGGHVYRGTAVPGLVGQYVYGDFCTGTISSLTAVDGDLVASTPDLGVGVAPFTLYAFGQGPDGELYVLSGGGSVSRLDPAGG